MSSTASSTLAGKKRRQTSDAVEILRHRFVEGDAESEAFLEEMRAEAEVTPRPARINR
jgi:uncharacterized membrane protein